jgi:hypothetical protein
LKFFYRSRLWTFIWAYVLLIYLTLPLMRSVLNALRGAVGQENLSTALNVTLVLAGLALIALGVRHGWKTLLHVTVPLAIILAVAYHLHIPEERVHFLQYGLLGLLVLKTSRVRSWLQLLAVAAFVIAVGAIDEAIQWLLPNRVGDLRDVAMNTLAGVMGVWIGTALHWPSTSPSP